VGALLAAADDSDVQWQELVAATPDAGRVEPDELEFAPVIPKPSKIVCVGLNYAKHITEMGRELPEFPTLFAKFPESLIGSTDDIQIPPESDCVDWEAELAVIISRRVRRAHPGEAESHIAGFTVFNDVTMRDWQYRSPMWLQGKTFEASSPLGPALVGPEELDGGTRPALEITTEVDGRVVQSATTDDLVFDPPMLVAYISTILTLNPGDVIATGTPGGVGHARKPPMYLAPGQVLATSIRDIGRLENRGVVETVNE
jgi:acylpyruvate hydrolase